jgi:hypothetical protein
VADQTGLDASELEEEAVRGDPGERHLVAWRRVDGGVAVLGVARTAASPASRSADDWLGGVPPSEAPARLVLQLGPSAARDRPEDDAAADAPADAVPVVEGDGWRARRDGAWTVLEAGGATWRALVGTPRDGADDLLVLEVVGGRELVRLAPR